ncbi:MAG TPA: DUF1538 family protein [Candidatus Binatia bacterium]
MLSVLQKVAQSVLHSARDLAPVLLVVIFFQLFIIREPLPGIEEKILGFVFVLIGLTLFVGGLDMSIFPLGESLGLFAGPEREPAAADLLRLLVGFRQHVCRPCA